jgi:hypothetical protein
MSTEITFTKLKKTNTWGLRGPGLKAGATVTVTKQDGSTVRKTVGKILWTGDGVSLATIDESGTPTARKAFGFRTGRYECDECGDFVAPGTTCWETGCRH